VPRSSPNGTVRRTQEFLRRGRSAGLPLRSGPRGVPPGAQGSQFRHRRRQFHHRRGRAGIHLFIYAIFHPTEQYQRGKDEASQIMVLKSSVTASECSSPNRTCGSSHEKLLMIVKDVRDLREPSVDVECSAGTQAERSSGPATAARSSIQRSMIIPAYDHKPDSAPATSPAVGAFPHDIGLFTPHPDASNQRLQESLEAWISSRKRARCSSPLSSTTLKGTTSGRRLNIGVAHSRAARWRIEKNTFRPSSSSARIFSA